MGEFLNFLQIDRKLHEKTVTSSQLFLKSSQNRRQLKHLGMGTVVHAMNASPNGALPVFFIDILIWQRARGIGENVR